MRTAMKQGTATETTALGTRFEGPPTIRLNAVRRGSIELPADAAALAGRAEAALGLVRAHQGAQHAWSMEQRDLVFDWESSDRDLSEFREALIRLRQDPPVFRASVPHGREVSRLLPCPPFGGSSRRPPDDGRRRAALGRSNLGFLPEAGRRSRQDSGRPGHRRLLRSSSCSTPTASRSRHAATRRFFRAGGRVATAKAHPRASVPPVRGPSTAAHSSS